mgnify:CR=1 FL=1
MIILLFFQGTNYQRTNPLSEINSDSRNKFWEEQEKQEQTRKELEIKKQQQENEQIEQERKKREVSAASEETQNIKAILHLHLIIVEMLIISNSYIYVTFIHIIDSFALLSCHR